MPNITPEQLHILHHTLGVRPDRREPYRNYYLAGPGHHSEADLEALVIAGMMGKRPAPKFCNESDVVYSCTEQGRSYALEALPEPPKLTRYQEYRQSAYAECGDSFADFLGITKPRLNCRSRFDVGARRSIHEYRYARYRHHEYERDVVCGEWATTKKAAKASHKAALKARRDARKVGA